MPLGKYLTAPIFVFNLAGEMMYILNQRLKAQNIAQEKGKLLVEFSRKSPYGYRRSHLQARVRAGADARAAPAADQFPEVPSMVSSGISSTSSCTPPS